jgi:hypothetical protein
MAVARMFFIRSASGKRQITSRFASELGQRVKADDVAVESLNQQLAERYQGSLDSGGRGIAVALRIEAGIVRDWRSHGREQGGAGRAGLST